MNVVVGALMFWIATVTGLPVPENQPEIAFVSQQEINQTVGATDGSNGVVAVYNTKTKTMLLNETWDLANVVDKSFLVHELVHHMVAESGKKYHCLNAEEKEAYEVQRKYLEDRNVDFFKAIDTNRLFYGMMTTCADIF